MSASIEPTEKDRREQGIKAGFLIGFADFIKWKDKQTSSKESLQIGILGTGPFKEMLEKAAASKKNSSRSIVVKSFSSPEEIEPVHVLFVCEGEETQWENVFQVCKDNQILSVSDMPEFTDEGGMLQFIKVKNRIKFRINVTHAEEANIKISSKLLRLAERKKS